MMKVVKVSAHVVDDHMDRVLMIASRIGWGEVVLEAEDVTHGNNCICCLTSTGIVLIKGRNGTLVTAYPATISRTKAMYNYYRNCEMPNYLYQKIVKNQKILRSMGM